MHTEFLPYKHKIEKDLPYRLGREMIRQALLIAARDEMGLATRDETLREIAPDSAATVRLLLSERANLNGTWEGKLKEDPTAFARLADHFKTRGDIESAIRCYEKSLAALPTVDATRCLSWIYLEQKDYAKWEQTLLKFLETEDLGLEHARVQQDLAYGFMHRGLWAKAKPHAVAAGETWSAWGLSAASAAIPSLNRHRHGTAELLDRLRNECALD